MRDSLTKPSWSPGPTCGDRLLSQDKSDSPLDAVPTCLMIASARLDAAAQNRSMNKPAIQDVSAIEREAEWAVLLAVTNLPVETGFASSTAVPAEAVRRLGGFVGSGVPTEELRRQVAAAIQRLEAEGFLYAPSDPMKCWRLIYGASSA